MKADRSLCCFPTLWRARETPEQQSIPVPHTSCFLSNFAAICWIVSKSDQKAWKQEIWKLTLNRHTPIYCLNSSHEIPIHSLKKIREKSKRFYFLTPSSKKLISPSKIMESWSDISHLDSCQKLALTSPISLLVQKILAMFRNLAILSSRWHVSTLTKIGIESNRKYNKLFWSRHKGV